MYNNGFSFGGIHSREFPVLVNAKQRSVAPPIEPRTLVVPGRAGALDYGYEIGVREIPVTITLFGADAIDYRAVVRDLASWLLPADRKPREIIFDDEPDKHYIARMSGQSDLNELWTLGSADITFFCADPYAYSNVDSSEVMWGSEAITFESSYLLGMDGTGAGMAITGPQSLTISNDGYATRPTFVINGTASGGVTFRFGEQSFSLPAFTNKSWYIDGTNFVAYRVEGSQYEQYFLAPNFPAEFPASDQQRYNAIGDMTGDFIELLRGDNEIEIEGSGLNFDLIVKFPFKYL